MKLSQKQKLMLAIIIFMITGFVLYSTFSSDSSTGVVSVNNVVSETGEIIIEQDENQDIIDLANEFENISMNLGIFNSPLFLNLKELNTPLSPEDVGKPNPFSNISSGSVSRVITGPQTTTKPKTSSEL